MSLSQSYGLVVAGPTVAIEGMIRYITTGRSSKRATALFVVTPCGVAPQPSIHFSSGKAILSRRNFNRRKYPCPRDEGF